MKVFVALILAVTLAVVYSESCRRDSDCSSDVTVCASGYTEKCFHGQCDCLVASGTRCVAQTDCASHTCRDNHDAHCVDGECHCWMMGGGNKGR